MTRIQTDLNESDIPILQGLEVEVLQDAAMVNKVVFLKCNNEKQVLEEAFKLIRMQQRVIDGQMAKVIYINDGPNKNVA